MDIFLDPKDLFFYIPKISSGPDGIPTKRIKQIIIIIIIMILAILIKETLTLLTYPYEQGVFNSPMTKRS